MFKQFSALALALSVAGLVGCGVTPNTTVSTTGDRFAVATLGQHGANVNLAFKKGFSTQATAHRWVEADIVRYDVVLTVQKADGGFETLDTYPVEKDAPGVRFKGLQFGKLYRVHVKIMGNEGGKADETLNVLNAKTWTQAGSGYAQYDFTADQDIVVDQDGTVSLQFDAVSFNGKGGLTIEGPEEGTFENEGQPDVEILPALN